MQPSLHADSLHSGERIKWSLWVLHRLGNNFGKGLHCHKVVAWLFWALCTLLYDFILAAIEWAQRDIRFWFSVSTPQLRHIYNTHTCFCSPQSSLFLFFFSLWQLKDQQHYSPCTWFVHLEGKNILDMMPAEPGALISYMRTQICTFCQSGGGFPTETRDWVSQNLNLKFNNEMKTSFEP